MNRHGLLLAMPDRHPMQNGTLLAAIDLGSNSFRLEIGRYHSGHIERIEYLKETVRLGGGLDDHKVLSHDAMKRGWDCLARFAERLHGFRKQQVRAVATQTLREARNRDEFLERAQAILGFPIEVVSGQEEARLIYQGVSHLLPQSNERRLVVDIGGRSTEVILGQGYDASRMESYRLGSVAWGKYFPRGQVTVNAFRTAEIAAKAVLEQALDSFPPTEWTVAYGSSGTVSAINTMLGANGWASGVVTRSGLDWLTERIVEAGNVHDLKLDGLKEDRRPVLCGGVSVLRAIFDLFDIQQMIPAKGALRQGALFDLIDRQNDDTDARERTVRWLAERFSIDEGQARRVSHVATALFAQIAEDDPLSGRWSQKLAWAARLHEIGTHISHDRSYHHGAYILDNVDAPGFSMPELHRMSQLVLGQRGKLKKLEQALREELFAKQLLCLRLAVLLCHARQMPDHGALRLTCKHRTFKLTTASGWGKRFPQSAWLLQEEAAAWQKTDWKLSLDVR